MGLPESLETSLGLRMPCFERGTAPRTKIAALEEYMLLTAFYQGAMAEDRTRLLVDLQPLERKWEKLTGWQPHVAVKTNDGVREAKRLVAPQLHDEIQDRKFLVQRLTEEMDRLERDATKASRVYTMMTGS